MGVVVPFEGVDEAGDGHKLVFHRGVDGVLDGLDAQQTVERGLILDLDTCGIDILCSNRVEHRLRFGTDDAGVLRTATGTARRLFRGFFLTILPRLLTGLALLLILLGCLCKLAGLDLLVGHLHLPVETEVVTVGEEEVLMVVAVPGL